MSTLISNTVKQIFRQKLIPSTNLVRTIISKNVIRTPDPGKPDPWPYITKKYTFWNSLFDKTTKRFDENTKLLVVEGPIACGKTVAAQDIASELGMLYLPEANLDMIYINHYGFDMRKLDVDLPESCRSFDVADFLANPNHNLTAQFQNMQYEVKFSQYVDALAHLLSTGQGVVLDRCAFSDFVFVEAMYAWGYLSKKARCKYYEIRDNTINELLKPHLIIYIDTPVQKVLENIEERQLSYEVNSKVIRPEYLKTIDKYYKEYLRTMSQYSELLIYDFSEIKDIEVVVEDIERLKLENEDRYETKFKDWDHASEEDWAVARRYYADQKHNIMAYFNVPCYEVPELIVDPMDAAKFYDVWYGAPGMKHEIGYNSDMGDGFTLFKYGLPHRYTLPMSERRDREEKMKRN